MNKKLIAVAVSSALAAPVIAQAEGETTLYGRIDQRLILKDESGADSKTDFGSSSRLGIKYDNELGNGLGVHARYEFATTTTERGGLVTRLGTAGVSGAFGRVDVGNQWSAYFDTFGTFASPVIAGTALFSLSGGPLRSNNTIKYSNTFGPVYLELDGRLNDSGEGSDRLNGDGIGIGVKFSAGEFVTIGLAADYEGGPDASDLRESVGKAAIAARTTAIQARAEAESLAVDGDVTAIDDARALPMTNEPQRTAAAAALTAAIQAAGAEGSAQRINAQRYSTSLTTEANAETAVASSANPDRADDTTRYGIAVQVQLGDLPVSVTGTWQNMDTSNTGLTPGGDEAKDTDVDHWSLWFAGDLGEHTRWQIGYGNVDGDGDDSDADQVSWSIHHIVGGGLRVYYAGDTIDRDDKSVVKFDGTTHILGLRVDF